MLNYPEGSLDLITKVLGNKYSSVVVKTISILDNLEMGVCHVTLDLLSGLSIKGSGVGMVDAIFSGLKSHFKGEFNSLGDIELNKFFVRAKSKGTNAEVEVELEVKNSYGKYFSFKDNSQSLTASSSRVSVAAIEYFVNSERAFFLVYDALQDAKQRGREDLVNRYESELAILVKNTSYRDLLGK